MVLYPNDTGLQILVVIPGGGLHPKWIFDFLKTFFRKNSFWGAQGVPRTFGKHSGPSRPKRGIQFFFGNFNFLKNFKFLKNIVDHKTQGWQGTYFHSKLVKNAKMCQIYEKSWWSDDFPGGSTSYESADVQTYSPTKLIYRN